MVNQYCHLQWQFVFFFSFYDSPSLASDMIDASSTMSRSLVATSVGKKLRIGVELIPLCALRQFLLMFTGYFLYDSVDMLRYCRDRSTYELLIHHFTVRHMNVKQLLRKSCMRVQLFILRHLDFRSGCVHLFNCPHDTQIRGLRTGFSDNRDQLGLSSLATTLHLASSCSRPVGRQNQQTSKYWWEKLKLMHLLFHISSLSARFMQFLNC